MKQRTKTLEEEAVNLNAILNTAHSKRYRDESILPVQSKQAARVWAELNQLAIFGKIWASHDPTYPIYKTKYNENRKNKTAH